MTKKEREILQAVRGHLVIARDAIDIGLNGKLVISATDIRKHGITMALGLIEEELKINNSITMTKDELIELKLVWLFRGLTLGLLIAILVRIQIIFT